MDEIYAWDEQNFYFDFFNCAYYYDYQAGNYSFVSVRVYASQFIFDHEGTNANISFYK
jgi:hypothetical protein